jgi:hypothetical protein
MICEQVMTTIVNHTERIESCSYTGMANIRVYFQPSATVEIAQIKAVTQTLRQPSDRRGHCEVGFPRARCMEFVGYQFYRFPKFLVNEVPDDEAAIDYVG